MSGRVVSATFILFSNAFSSKSFEKPSFQKLVSCTNASFFQQ